MAIRTTCNVSTGHAPLALLTGRDFLTPFQVEMNGAPDIDQAITGQEALREANRKEGCNERLARAQCVGNFRRVCDRRLPFFAVGGGDVNVEIYTQSMKPGKGAGAQGREQFRNLQISNKKGR